MLVALPLSPFHLKDVDHSRGKPGLHHELGHAQGGQGSLLGGLPGGAAAAVVVERGCGITRIKLQE